MQTSWFLVLVLQIASVHSLVVNEYVGNEKFNHLAVDKVSGRVYVGVVNRLYQLSADLNLEMAAATGPMNDSPECSITNCPKSAVKKPTDNVNKVLLIDYKNSRLIVCGSVFQGVCSARNLSNILEEDETMEAVVANDVVSSTVAFIAPGPPRPPLTEVMYVGVTNTANSAYRSEIPAISSRSLEKDSMFQIAKTDVGSGTRMFVISHSRQQFKIHYVYGFSSDGFSYFLTRQFKSLGNNVYISKIVRLCQSDESYHSYAEIPISCTGQKGKSFENSIIKAAYLGRPGSILAKDLGISTEEDVLYTVFTQKSSPRSNTPLSGVCIYSMKAIRLQFMHSIQNCFNGKGSRGLDFISPTLPCVLEPQINIHENFCGSNINTPFGGEDPITALPIIFFNTRLTSIAAVPSNEFTVILVGTFQGHIVKITIETTSDEVKYKDIMVDVGYPVNKDLYFDRDFRHLYVMTDRKVSRVRVFDCGPYSTCLDCIGANDAFCGWCPKMNKCTTISECQDDYGDSSDWISYRSGQCSINKGMVKEVATESFEGNRSLELIIEDLPTLSGQFKCTFVTSDKILISSSVPNYYNIRCMAPINDDQMATIPAGEHTFVAKLSAKTSFVDNFYIPAPIVSDCNSYSSCTQCVMSNFPCDWCLNAHRCTSNIMKDCQNDMLVTSINKVGPKYRSGSDYCPIINSTATGSSEILVHAGLKESIRVKVNIIDQFIFHSRFQCQFIVNGRKNLVNAKMIGYIVHCDPFQFYHNSSDQYSMVSFAVVWGGSKYLDNPKGVHVMVYRCRTMAENCGTCVSLDSKFGCEWCPQTNRCELKEHCYNGPRGRFHRNQSCPNPEIHIFSPENGPWEGGTEITIDGINLGQSFADVQNGITIAGIICRPIENMYIKSKRIGCIVDGTPWLDLREGPVVVKVGEYTAVSKNHYAFVDPQLESISPSFGPKSGGTQMRITGRFMDAGSDIEIFINNKLCVVLDASNNETVCRTPPNDEKEYIVKMTFDNAERQLNRHKFEYLPDPAIYYTHSGQASDIKSPKGIPSGGNKIKVVGTGFNAIQFPQIYVRLQKIEHVGRCEIITSNEMICDSPKIEMELNIDAENPLNLEYGFNMDDVQRVRNLSTSMHPFLLYPNPSINRFDDGVKAYEPEGLILTGSNLNKACQEADYEVTIGKSFCKVTSLTDNELICEQPALKELNFDNQNFLDVTVVIGNSLDFKVGKMSFNQKEAEQDLSLYIFIAIGVVGGILIIVLILLCYLLCRDSKSDPRDN